MAQPKGGKGTTGKEKDIRVVFMRKCWSYLNDNFHKLSQANKIKVSLEMAKKNIPLEISGEIKTVTTMPSIKINGKDLEVNIGSD